MEMEAEKGAPGWYIVKLLVPNLVTHFDSNTNIGVRKYGNSRNELTCSLNIYIGT